MNSWIVLVGVLLFTPNVPAGKIDYFSKAAKNFCSFLEECDLLWESGTAYTCSDNNECECHPEARFVENRCECRPGFVMRQRECVRSDEIGRIRTLQSGLGERCSSDSDCNTIDNIECSSGTCKCKNGSVSVDGLCKEVAKQLGEGCETEVQCSTFLGTNVDCLNYQCTCRTKYVPSQSKQACLPELGLYERCNEPVQCIPTNSTTCKDGICSCLPGFSSIESARCMPDKAYGEECSHPAECNVKSGDFAGCRDRKCTCESNAYYNGSVCLKKNGLDETCNPSQFEGCYHEKGGYEYMECNEGKCRCKSNAKVAADGAYCESSGVIALASISMLLAALLASTSV